MRYTVDASVFVASLIATDIHYAPSLAFPTGLRSGPDLIYCPSLCPIEVASAVVRQTGDALLARSSARIVERFPRMSLVDLSLRRAKQACRLAAAHRLRGADTVYVAVAAEYGTTVITWDHEMLTRASAVVPARTPTDWLASRRP